MLQEPDTIVEYDVARFVALRTLKVPRPLLEHPEYLTVNAKGQMIFLPSRGVQGGSEEKGSAADLTWFWDGRDATELRAQGARARGVGGSQKTLTESVVRWFLSAGGDSLFRFDTTFDKVRDETGAERSVRSTSQVWRTDLAGDRPEKIASFSTPGPCPCETGVCDETCPAWEFWAPDGVVGDFFLITRVTAGQLGATYHESLLHERSGRTWRAKKMPIPVEQPLIASQKGEVLVAAVPDHGCCGWDNESSDQILMLSNGSVSVLYDEFGHYDNRNYDVSVYTANARLAPGYLMLAYTIASTARPGSEIRLSSDGKENAGELARVRSAIAELPAVEVAHLGSPPRGSAVIRRAALVGWVSHDEILVAQDGRLAVYDIRGNRRRDTTIHVRSAADAFLR